MLKLPAFPQKDSVSRSSFIPITVDLRPPAGSTVSDAIVEFGYSTNLYCTARTEVCVATKAAIDESNPFLWPTEVGGSAGVTGVPCSTGCRITIPGISGKVLYYRWKYRDAAKTVQAISGLQVVAVP
jgi:hypothetical protein